MSQVNNNSANLSRYTNDLARAKGTSIDELRVNLDVAVEKVSDESVDPVAIQPMATREAADFISPSNGADNLRLLVPNAANPFASPTGPVPVHMLLRRALERFGGQESRDLIAALDSPRDDIPVDAQKKMRASLSRLHAMDTILRQVGAWAEHINAHRSSRQNG